MLKKSSFNFLRKRLFSALVLVIIIGGAMSCYAQESSRAGGSSELKAKLVNIESATNEPFRFSVTLYNRSASPQLYELKSDLPIGWQISYKVDGSPVTSVNTEAQSSREIAVEITAPANAPAKKYVIPLRAVSGSSILLLQLEAVVKGNYAVALGTPSGRLSEEVTSGSHKDITLEVSNTGTLPLSNLEVTAQLPSGWEASFEPAKITKLDGGGKATVKVSLKVPDKTIAGDYAATFNLGGSNVSSQAAFRIFVRTAALSGWMGIMIILIAVGSVYALIRKYGRR